VEALLLAVVSHDLTAYHLRLASRDRAPAARNRRTPGTHARRCNDVSEFRARERSGDLAMFDVGTG
jgi:hypothetical protein